MNNSCSKRYKSSASYVFFTQYGVPLLNNQIKILSSPLKAKMNENLDFSLSWGSFVYYVKKSYATKF